MFVSRARAAGMAPMIQRAQIRYLSTSWKMIVCTRMMRIVSGLVRAKAQAGMRRSRPSMKPMSTALSKWPMM